MSLCPTFNRQIRSQTLNFETHQACKVHNISRSQSFEMERAALKALKLHHHPVFPFLVDCNSTCMLLFTTPVVKPLGELLLARW